MGNGAIAIIGKTGYGKSSTAMQFYNKGYPIIADDFVAIKFLKDNKPIVTPGFPKLKLSYDYIISNKINLQNVLSPDPNLKSNYVDVSKGFSSENLLLKKIYIIEKGDTFALDRLQPQEIFKRLVSNTFAIKVLQKLDNGRNLDYYSKIVNSVPINSLMVPQSLEKLPQVVKLIEEDIIQSKKR